MKLLSNFLSGLGAFGVFLLIVVFVVFAFAVAPFLAIWSLNTLSENTHWGWHIDHTFWNYFAVFLLIVVFGRNSVSKS